MIDRETCLDTPLIAAHLEAIRALCREYGVARLEVFGSVCTPEFDLERSDVDFLVEYPDEYDYGPWLQRHFDLEEALTNVLSRKVDVVMPGALRNKWFRREAEKTRTVIYDASEVAEVA
ncbi:MAG: nucleotidyltransferase family protein [Thermomicrobiales bacterium]